MTVVTLYTPGIGAEFDQRSITLDPFEVPYVQVPCWGGCEDGIYDPTCGLPDAGQWCVECRGTGRRWVAVL